MRAPLSVNEPLNAAVAVVLIVVALGGLRPQAPVQMHGRFDSVTVRRFVVEDENGHQRVSIGTVGDTVRIALLAPGGHERVALWSAEGWDEEDYRYADAGLALRDASGTDVMTIAAEVREELELRSGSLLLYGADGAITLQLDEYGVVPFGSCEEADGIESSSAEYGSFCREDYIEDETAEQYGKAAPESNDWRSLFRLSRAFADAARRPGAPAM